MGRFGGKRRVAHHVWDRFGDVASYNEPFAGSLAVLLARPTAPKVETVNDLDAALANFWRALKHDPDAVAYHCDDPVNEVDLHARHKFLVANLPALREKAMADPEYYDAKMAGWWVYGICLWIGSGWCQNPHRTAGQSNCHGALPDRGVQSARAHAARRWQGGGKGAGSGVIAPALSQTRRT